MMLHITKKGNVSLIYSYTNAKSELNPKIKNEIMRVLNHIPLLKPGIRKGKPVNVKYGISIHFQDGDIKIKSGSGPY